MKFVQYHPNYCEEAKGAPVRDWDTSHDATVLYDGGGRAKAAHFKHADWAQAFCDLMNARYEGGEMALKVRERVARAIFYADPAVKAAASIYKDFSGDWEGQSDESKAIYLQMADVAITAILGERNR